MINLDRLGTLITTPAKTMRKAYLSEDAKELVAEFEEALREARGDLEAHNREAPTQVSVNGEINSLKKDRNRLESELRQVDKDLKKVGHELRESEEAEKEDTTVYEEELAELRLHKTAQGDMESMESDLREKRTYADGITTELNSIAAREEELKVLMETKGTALAQEIKRVQNAERTVRSSERTMLQVKPPWKLLRRWLSSVRSNTMMYDQKLKKRRANLCVTGTANRFHCKRRDTKDRLAAQAKAATRQLEEEKARNEVSGLTLTVAAERYRSAKEALTSAVKTHEILTDQTAKMKMDEKARKQSYKAHLESCSERVDRLFSKYLTLKGFTGDIDFEHPSPKNNLKRGRLNMRVNKDGNDLGDGSDVGGGDVRQLSGGERSFTTLCLLLALGHVVDSPFRVMDEYDVFLDEMSRKITLDQITEYALDVKQSSKQFIIITPNNLEDVRTSQRCKIIAMQNPERRSATGLQQRTID